MPDASTDVAEREWLMTELGRLDIDRRAVVVLHYYLDLTVDQVADVLDIPRGTAASRLYRGLDQLRTSLSTRSEASDRPFRGARAMNDRIDFERLVNERFAREHDIRPPDRAVDQILTEAGRWRPLPRWLALIKEPSMRYSSTLAVGSPTVRVLALLAATLLLVTLVTAAGAGAARLLAADGLHRRASGGGALTAIADAVASGSTATSSSSVPAPIPRP